jgi:6-phosphogluconolactonase
MTRICTLADPETVAQRAAREIAQHITNARRERGVAHVALSGGHTPERAHELLAETIEDWQGVEVWFADERCVGPEDESSNYLMVRRTLLERIAGTRPTVHRMEGELGPEKGAERYARALRANVTAGKEGLPVLDAIVLGIGPDGHTASLFPGASTLSASEQEICLGVRDSPKPPPERITLSLAVLREARRCLLPAVGAGKREAVQGALGPATPHVPASLLRRERLTLILDDAASPPPPLADR